MSQLCYFPRAHDSRICEKTCPCLCSLCTVFSVAALCEAFMSQRCYFPKSTRLTNLCGSLSLPSGTSFLPAPAAAQFNAAIATTRSCHYEVLHADIAAAAAAAFSSTAPFPSDPAGMRTHTHLHPYARTQTLSRAHLRTIPLAHTHILIHAPPTRRPSKFQRPSFVAATARQRRAPFQCRSCTPSAAHAWDQHAISLPVISQCHLTCELPGAGLRQYKG